MMEKEELIKIHTLFEEIREEREREYFRNNAGVYEELAPPLKNESKMTYTISKIKKIFRR